MHVSFKVSSCLGVYISRDAYNGMRIPAVFQGSCLKCVYSLGNTYSTLFTKHILLQMIMRLLRSVIFFQDVSV